MDGWMVDWKHDQLIKMSKQTLKCLSLYLALITLIILLLLMFVIQYYEFWIKISKSFNRLLYSLVWFWSSVFLCFAVMSSAAACWSNPGAGKCCKAHHLTCQELAPATVRPARLWVCAHHTRVGAKSPCPSLQQLQRTVPKHISECAFIQGWTTGNRSVLFKNCFKYARCIHF